MVRPLDHVIVAVRDVEAGIGTFERLGFNPSPRMFHSFGTSNSLVMFGRTFIEILGDFDRAPEGTVRDLGAGIEEQEGLVQAALLSTDVAADHQAFDAAGLAPPPAGTFTRDVPMPDGTTGEVLCSVAFAPYPASPMLACFVSHQHRPQFVWIPEWQLQPNGVVDIVGITFRVDDVSTHRGYLEAVVGATLDDDDATLTTQHGFIRALASEDLMERYPKELLPPDRPVRERGVVLTLRTALPLSDLETMLGAAGVDTSVERDRVLVGHADAAGVLLEFVR